MGDFQLSSAKSGPLPTVQSAVLAKNSLGLYTAGANSVGASTLPPNSVIIGSRQE